MRQLSQKQSTGLAILFAALIFAAKAIFIATRSLRGLALTSWIIDDVFIVMRVARNVALGHGFTYDGIHATTGSPPLWTYLTSINHWLPLEWAVKTTMIEMGLFGALTTLLVFLIARRLTGKESVAWIAMVLSTFTGPLFYQAMNGMETAMFTFFAILSVALWLGILVPQSWTMRSQFILVGLALGLTCMIRGDGIFFVGAIGLMQIVRFFGAKREERKAIFIATVVMTVTWLCLQGILLGWQLHQTGSLLLGNQVGRRSLALILHNFSYDHFSLMQYLKISVWNIFQLLPLITLAIGSWLLLPLSLFHAGKDQKMKAFTGFLWIYCIAFFGTLTFYQWYFPDLHGLRYLNPVAHLLFVPIAIVITDLIATHRAWIWRSLFVIAFAVVSQYNFYHYTIHLKWAAGMSFFATPTAAEETKGWATMDWAQVNLPAGTIVGVRDHGRFALFADRPVQDLAGTVDPNINTEVKNGTLMQYLEERNVQYVYIPEPGIRNDPVYAVLHESKKLRKVAGAPLYGIATLYKIEW